MSFFQRMLQCACPTSVPTEGNVRTLSTSDLECRITHVAASPVPFDGAGSTIALSLVLVLLALMALWWLVMAVLYLRRFGCSVPNPMQWLQQKPKEESGFDRRVKALLAARKLERYNIGTRAIGAAMPPLLVAYYVWVLYRISSSPASSRLLVYGYVFENGSTVAILLCFWSLFASTFPGRLTQFSADVICSFFFLACSLVNSFTQNDMNYVWLSSFVLLAQIMLTMFMASFRVVLIPNLINFAWQLVLVSATDALQPNRGTLLVSLVLQTTFIQLMGFMAEDWLQTEVAAKAREIEASKAVTTAHSLLSVLCDAVVPLGPDHTLQEPCPKLTTLLLRDPRSSSRGQLFSDFLQRGDKDRFEEFMADPGAMPGKSRSLHVHLVDSVGTLVPVQLFHTSVEDLDGGMSHLIGVTEDKDTDAFAPFRVPPASHACLEPVPMTRQYSDDGHSVVSAQSDSSSHSVSSVLPVWESNAGNLMLKAKMRLELLWESEASKAFFNFTGTSDSFFLSRFREPSSLWRWLLRSQLNAEDVCQYGAVQIWDVPTGLSREAHLRVKFQHGDESLGMTFLLRPPGVVQRDRRQARNRSLRRTRMLVGEMEEEAPQGVGARTGTFTVSSPQAKDTSQPVKLAI